MTVRLQGSEAASSRRWSLMMMPLLHDGRPVFVPMLRSDWRLLLLHCRCTISVACIHASFLFFSWINLGRPLVPVFEVDDHGVGFAWEAAGTMKVWLDRVVTKWTKVLVACPGQLSCCKLCQYWSLGRLSRCCRATVSRLTIGFLLLLLVVQPLARFTCWMKRIRRRRRRTGERCLAAAMLVPMVPAAAPPVFAEWKIFS